MADTTNIYEKPREQLTPEEQAREQQEKLERQKRGRERVGKTIDTFGKHLDDKEIVESLPQEVKKDLQQVFLKAVMTVPGRSKERPKTREKSPEHRELSEKREMGNERLMEVLDAGNEALKESMEKEEALNKLSLVQEVALVYAEYLSELKSRVRGNLLQGDRMESYDRQIKIITDLLLSSEKTVSTDSKSISRKADEIIAQAFKNEYIVSGVENVGNDALGVGKDIGVDKGLAPRNIRGVLDMEKRGEMSFTKIRDILSSSATLDTNELLSKKIQTLSLLRLHDTHDSDPRVLNSSEAIRSSLETDFLAMNDLSKYPKISETFTAINALKKDPVAQKEFFSLLFPEGTVPELNTNTFHAFFQKHNISINSKHIGEIVSRFSDIRKEALIVYQGSIKGKDSDTQINLSELAGYIRSNQESLASGQSGCMDMLSRSLIQKVVFENFSTFDTFSKTNPLAKLYTNIEGLQASETDPRHEKGFTSTMRAMGSEYLSDERVNSDAKYQQEIAEQVFIMVGVGKAVGSASKWAGEKLAEKFGNELVTSRMTSVGDFVGSRLIGKEVAPILATSARLGTETLTEGGAFALGYTQLDNLVGNKGWENGMNLKDLGRITAFLGIIKTLNIGMEVMKPMLGGLAEKYGEKMRTMIETKGIADPKVMDALVKELGTLAKNVSKPRTVREGMGIAVDTTTLILSDTIIRVMWDQGVPNIHEKQNVAEYMQSELEAIIPLVLGIRSIEHAKGPVNVSYEKDGSLLVTLEGQITKITKEQRRLIQARNIARRDGDRNTVANINAERRENKEMLAGLQSQKNLADSVAKTISANEPFPQGNTNHPTPNLREMRESMRNPNIEKVAKGFGFENKLQGEVTLRFQELLANFPSISKKSERHEAIRKVMATEVDTLITRLEADKDFNYGQDKAELEKFRQNREHTISDLMKQFEEALKAKSLGEKMDPKWGKVEYVDKVMGMFYEKMNPEMKEEKYNEDDESNKKPKSKRNTN